MATKKKRRKYSKEFKAEAVKLVLEQGITRAQASRDLGVAESVLGRWVQLAERNAQPGAITAGERDGGKGRSPNPSARRSRAGALNELVRETGARSRRDQPLRPDQHRGHASPSAPHQLQACAWSGVGSPKGDIVRTLPEHGRLLVLGCFLSVSPSCFAIDGDGDGVTPADGDCDDSDPYVYADAPGRCDGVDNDCDGVTDTYCGRLSVGWDHACAIAPSGEVVCWGQNTWGESDPPEGEFVWVSAGWTRSCGLRPDGEIECWGYETGGPSPPVGPFVQVEAGPGYTCGLRAEGTIECWAGDLGKGNTGQTDSPEGQFTSMSLGNAKACAVGIDGQLSCWALPLGDGPPTGSFTRVSIADAHACAVRDTGEVACWGVDTSGQSSPPASQDVVQVGVGMFHSCALRLDGQPICWGDPGPYDFGQSDPPTGVFQHLDSGHHFACAMSAEQLTCWGEDEQGQSTPPALL